MFAYNYNYDLKKEYVCYNSNQCNIIIKIYDTHCKSILMIYTKLFYFFTYIIHLIDNGCVLTVK